MGPKFWDVLIQELSPIYAHKINLAFVGDEPEDTSEPDQPAIYITHSLGTMWALKNHAQNMKALIAINGFSCFQNFTDKKTLRAMKLRLKSEPQEQMNDFWELCGLPESDELNIDNLAKGLEWLSTWNAKEELKKLSCSVLSLAGGKDPILPVDVMKEEWTGFDFKIKEDGSHALPVTDTKWCAEKIQGFVDGL